MNKTKITKIVEKELLEFFDAKTLLRHNKEIMEFAIESTLKAINYTHCCKGEAEQLPIVRCGCEEPDPTEIKVCVQCDGYVE